jgi:hypothetical protein
VPVDRTVPVVLALQPATVTLSLGLAVLCSAGPIPATQAVAAVLDGRNQPVESTADAPSTLSTGYSTNVRFTPVTPGLYLVTVRFEPSLGVVLRQVQVVADFSQVAPVARFLPSETCSAVGLVGSVVVCQGAEELEVVRDGGRVQRIIAKHFSSAGAVLWAWSATEVARLEDTGAGPLVGTTLLEDGLAGVVGTAASSEGRLLAIAGSTLLDIVYDGGLSVAGRRAVVGTASRASGLVVSPDGVLVWGAEGQSVCRGWLDGGSSCATVQLSVGAAEADGLWVRSVESDAIGLLRFPADALVPSVTFLPGRSAELIDRGDPVPVFGWGDWRVTMRVDDLTLEGWRLVGAASGGASPSLVWLAGSTGEVLVYRR